MGKYACVCVCVSVFVCPGETGELVKREWEEGDVHRKGRMSSHCEMCSE